MSGDGVVSGVGSDNSVVVSCDVVAVSGDGDVVFGHGIFVSSDDVVSCGGAVDSVDGDVVSSWWCCCCSR